MPAPQDLSDFLSDIEAEKHQFLLERGNLVRKPAPVPFTPVWTYLGHRVRILENRCACGEISRHITSLGVLAQNPQGATKETACTWKDISESDRKNLDTVTLIQPIPVCPSCIGFSP